MSEETPEEKEKLIATISEMIGDVPDAARYERTVRFIEALAAASRLDPLPFVQACGHALARLGYGPYIPGASKAGNKGH